MGYHLDTMYIGPAIKVKPQKKMIPVNIIACSNDNCQNSYKPLRDKFCKECGSPVISSRVIEEPTEISFYEFVNDDSGAYRKYDGDLHQPPYDKDGIWIPNRQTKGMSAFCGEISETTITVSDKFSENMAKQILIFNGYFDQLFTDMRAYGLEIETVYVIKTYGS